MSHCQIICYVNGYKGLLLGDSILVTPGIRATAGALHLHGGSPIGNSRVKLTNYKDCLKRGLVKEGEVRRASSEWALSSPGRHVFLGRCLSTINAHCYSC